VPVVLSGLLAAGLLVAALRGDSYDVIPRSEAFMSIWWAVGLAVAFGLLPRHRWSLPARLAFGGLLALAAWTAIGLIWTGSAERTIAEVLRVLGYAGLVALVAWAFGARDRTMVVGMVAVVAATVCVLALISRLWPELLESATARAGYFPARLSYPFNYWNALGCWAAMTLALTLAFSVHASHRWVRGVSLAAASIAPAIAYLTYSRTALVGAGLALALVVGFSSRRWLAAFNAAVVAVGATAIVLAIRAAPEIARAAGTGGRWGVAGVVVVVAAVATTIGALGPHQRLAGVRMSSRRTRRLLRVAVAIGLITVIAAGPPLAVGAWRSFERDTPVVAAAKGDPAERLTNLAGNRRLLWTVALDVFRDHPMRGVGAGTFEFAWNQDARRGGHVLDAHSLVIESLAEVGLPGALLVVLALGALLVGAVRASSLSGDGTARGAAVGCAAAFVVFCISANVDWMWESTAITFAGLIVGTVALAGTGAAIAGPRRGLRVGVGLATVAAILIQIPVLVGANQIRSSQAQAARGQFVEALRDANAAVQAEPWAADAYLQRGLALEQVGQLERAAAAIREATRREPDNWEHWLVLSRIEAERGRIEPALAAVSRARALNPSAPIFHPGVARALTGSSR
jgi:O-antigen ligase